MPALVALPSSVDPAGNNAIVVGSGANLLARQTQIEDAFAFGEHTGLANGGSGRGNSGAYSPRQSEAVPYHSKTSPRPRPFRKTRYEKLDILVVNENGERVARRSFAVAADGAGSLRDRLGVTVVSYFGR